MQLTPFSTKKKKTRSLIARDTYGEWESEHQNWVEVDKTDGANGSGHSSILRESLRMG